MKVKLLGKTPAELKEIVLSEGLPAYTAGQLAQWIYVKKASSIDRMTNISKAGREKLSEKYEVGVTPYVGLAVSSDGTKKYLFPVSGAVTPQGTSALSGTDTGEVREGRSILSGTDTVRTVETVMIPDGERATLCVSSQAGCRMGCKFCMTGRQGFHGHLSAADILSQFLAVDEADRLTNAVFMGMGEPLDNYEAVMRAVEVLTADWGFGWSPKRITLSTIGVLPVLKKYIEQSRCHLAVSLHNPFPEERLSMMPVEKAYHIRDIVSLIKEYDFSGQRRVSFEYTMFGGFNDTVRHADALIRLLRGLECRVNLIRFHQIPDFPYTCSPDLVMQKFRQRLERAGIVTTIRASRGEDILAACGLLSTTGI